MSRVPTSIRPPLTARALTPVYVALIVIGSSAVAAIILVLVYNASLSADRAARRAQNAANLAELHSQICTAVASAFPPGSDALLARTEARIGCPSTRPIAVPSASSVVPSASSLGPAAGAAPTALLPAGTAPALTPSARPAPSRTAAPSSSPPRPSATLTSPAPLGCVLTLLLPIGGCP